MHGEDKDAFSTKKNLPKNESTMAKIWLKKEEIYHTKVKMMMNANGFIFIE